MKVVMVGTGYVGLVSGACFSEFGANVTCVDKDIEKISSLNSGNIPIYEPGLDEIVKRNLDSGRLHFTSDLPEATRDADLIFIAVGTPSRRGDGHADLKYVFAAAEEIANNVSGYTVIVNKSTVPVGTTEQLNGEYDINIIHSPEFLTARTAVTDFICPSRHIIGGHPARGINKLQKLYESRFPGVPCLIMSSDESEFVKYFANCFFATKVSFFNEMRVFSDAKCLDWQNIDNFQIEDFEEITSFDELKNWTSCINEEIATKEDWDNVTLKKFVKGEAVNKPLT